MKEPIDTLFDIIKVILIALLIVIPVRYFLFQPFVVNGQSMEPNYSNGDYLIVDEISYRFKDPVRGDVIAVSYTHLDVYKRQPIIIGERTMVPIKFLIDRMNLEIVFCNEDLIVISFF